MLKRLLAIAGVAGMVLAAATTGAQASSENPARIVPATPVCYTYTSGATTYGVCGPGGHQFRLHFGCITTGFGAAGFTGWQNTPGTATFTCASPQTADPNAAYTQSR